MNELWFFETGGGTFNVSFDTSHFLFQESFIEFNNFLKDLNIKFVDFLSLWDPFSVDLFLKLSFSWGNSFTVGFDVRNDVFSEILIGLSGSSPFVGDTLWILELDVSWSFLGSSGEFSLSDLVVPGSDVHIIDSLGGSFPVLGLSLKFGSGVLSVLEVGFEGFLDLPFQFVSLVKILIELGSDFLGLSLFSVGDQRLWFLSESSLKFVLDWSVDILVGFDGSILVSLPQFWPLSFSGSLEFSFISGNGFFVSNPVLNELISSLNISSLSISPFVNDSLLVVNLEAPFSILLFCEVDLFHLELDGILVFLVDDFLLGNEFFHLSSEFLSLVNGSVREVLEVFNDGFIESPSSLPSISEIGFNISCRGKRVWVLLLEVSGKFFP